MSSEPLIMALLYEAQAKNYPLNAFVLRKEPKAHGLRKQLEGPTIQAGARVVLVDDLVNSGKTLKQALEILQPFRPQLVAVATLINYERAGARWLASIGVPVESIFSMGELGMALRTPTRQGIATLDWTWEVLNKGEYTAPKSSPYITEDAIFVGSDRGFLLALTRNGHELWRYPVRDSKHGIHSSPVVLGDRVYFGAYDGYVYCLNTQNGALIWETQPGQWIGSSPAIDATRNHMLIGTERGNNGGSLVALNADGGSLVWELKTGGYIHSSPCFDAPRNQVIVGSNDFNVYAADADTGAERWRFHTDGEIKGRVVMDEASTCFVASFDGFLYSLDARTGSLLWKRKLGNRLYFDPLILEDLVVVGSYSWRVVALERATGTIRGIATTGGRVLGGACLLRDNAVAVGSADGCVYLFDGTSGEALWQHRTDAPVRTTPNVLGNQLVVPSCDGKLYSFSYAAGAPPPIA
jgi:outer membrane protein assembly factor BamB